MGFSIDGYFEIENNNTTVIEIVPSKEIETRLIIYHQKKGHKIVALWELIEKDEYLPSPNEIYKKITERINKEKKHIFVRGITAYLQLVNSSRRNDFFVYLKNHLDDQDLNATICIEEKLFDNHEFKNPKYNNSLQIVNLVGEMEILPEPKITMMPSKYCTKCEAIDSFGLLLKNIDSNYSDEYILKVKKDKVDRTGLNNSINLSNDPLEILSEEVRIDLDISPEIAGELLIDCTSNGITVENFIEKKITSGEREIGTWFSQLNYQLKGKYWSFFASIIMQRISKKSYLYRVLENKPTSETFLHCYYVDTPIKLLDDEEAASLADERKRSKALISEQEYLPLITEFVSKTRDLQKAIRWYNCGTIEERCELIRRASCVSLKDNIPEAITAIYPDIGYYISNEYEYPDKTIDDYFKKYRNYKLKNKLDDEFVKTAHDFSIPNSTQFRDDILAKYRNDEHIALQVVDGLGAEYIPYLLKIFEGKYCVEDCYVAYVNLPSSTRFNEIRWDKKLPEIKGIDNTGHNGAIKNEITSFEANLNESFRVLREELLSRISKNIGNYSKIIITSDHGLSRLAVLANELNLAKTIDDVKDPLDWRYTISDNVYNQDDLITRYDAKEDKRYWIVKGYNRLAKSGGKKYELHGGASCEEMLVPVIILSELNKQNDKDTTTIKKKPSQMKEKSLFADL